MDGDEHIEFKAAFQSIPKTLRDNESCKHLYHVASEGCQGKVTAAWQE